MLYKGVQVPSSYREITIRQFTELRDVKEDNPARRMIKMLSILLDKREEEVRKIPINTLRKIDLSFLSKDPEGKLPGSFRLKGKRYRPVLDLTRMDAGQYIDLVTYAKDPDENLHEIIALMCHGKDQVQARADLFYQHMPVSIAYPLGVFFCKAWTHFTRGILRSSLKMSMNRIDQLERSRTESTGAGT